MKYIIFVCSVLSVFTCFCICSVAAQQKDIVFAAQPVKDSLTDADSFAETVLCYTDVPLTKAQPECTIGDMMSDMMLASAKEIDPQTKAAILNQGCMRIAYISPGPVTNRTIRELLPYNNKLVIAEIPGDTLKKFCDHIAAQGGWPVSGISFRIKEKEAVDILIDGKPLNEHIVYKVAVNDYIAYGGNGCGFLKRCRKNKTGILVRELVVRELTNQHLKGQKINIRIGERITYVE